MARTRLIRPAFFKHAELYDAEVASVLPLRVAFAGLWTVADKEGRFPWKPRELKTDILPHDALDFGRVLDVLEAQGFVQRYVVEGTIYGLIPSFKSHQTFHKSEPGSKLPTPVGPPLPPRVPPVATTADSVAVAVTDADTSTDQNDRTPVGRRWKPVDEQRLAERLTTGAGRNALTAILTVAGSKAGVVAEIEALLCGARGKQHLCTPEQLDVALSDYVTNGMSSGRWNAQHFRACVRRAMQPAPEQSNAQSNGDAGTYVAKIRALIRLNPGRGNYLPKTEVAALGDNVLRAYESVGGADRFLNIAAKDLPFLIRDFGNAMRGGMQ